MNLDTHQRAFHRWLDAAGGRLQLVEMALIQARKNAGGQPPSFHAVLAEAQRLNAERPCI